MDRSAETGARLSIAPPVEAGDAAFLAGFSRHVMSSHDEFVTPVVASVARIWPGQPAVPSPWVTCTGGCCLMLATTRATMDTAGQWLRFLIAEFLSDQHRVDGQIVVPGVMGRHPVLLIVEAGVVFEGDLGDGAASGTMT